MKREKMGRWGEKGKKPKGELSST